jgi:hypothetical protein
LNALGFEKHLEKISLDTKSKIKEPSIVIGFEEIAGRRMEGFVVSLQ